MREIKFRIWNGKDSYCTDSFVESNLFNTLKFNPELVQQFTGLKDKNGKEIYEGDIVKGTMHYSNEMGESQKTGHKSILEVKWKKDKGMQYSGFCFFPQDDIDKLEVIGNIYENPELLK